MIKASETKKIAKKFGWKIDETELAVKEFFESPSIVTDKEKYFKICMKAHDKDERDEECESFLLDDLTGDVGDIICSLFRVDISFILKAYFNQHEDLLKYDDYKHTSRRYKRSFVNPNFGSLKKSVQNLPNIIIIDALYSSISFMELLIVKNVSLTREGDFNPNYYNDLFKILIKVVSQVGLLAFNIQDFREIVNELVFLRNIDDNEKKINKLLENLIDPTINRTKITKQRYWLIYSLVETLKIEGLGLNESFRKASDLLNYSVNSVKRRYWENKKKVKTNKLNLHDVIFQNNLTFELSKLIETYYERMSS